MVLLLGTAGYGVMGFYMTISDLVRSIAGMGVNTSGVRQIAEAAGSGEAQRLARTVITLRRVAFYTGALGALLLLIFCRQVSRLTFGDEHHARGVALISLAVFFGDVSAGQAALVQGMRRIADLAKMSVLGAVYGTLFSIPIVYYYYRQGMAEKGVAPSLVCVAAMSILTSWWYARKVKVERVKVTLQETLGEVSALLKLGIVFMSTGLMTFGGAYLIRIYLRHEISLEAVGLYQSAWMLSSLYIGVILQAMGADFFPRLTAVADNNPECNRLVNEQAEVGMLMASPGIIATLTFTPIVISLFFSSKFGPAVDLLRWTCLGHGAAGGQLAHRLYLPREKRTEHFLLDRSSLQCGLRGVRLGEHSEVWIDRSRGGLFRDLHRQFERQLYHCPPVERLPVVAGKPAAGVPVYSLDRRSLCHPVHPVRAGSNYLGRDRDAGNRSLLDENIMHPGSVGTDATTCPEDDCISPVGDANHNGLIHLPDAVRKAISRQHRGRDV